MVFRSTTKVHVPHNTPDEYAALAKVMDALRGLESEVQERILKTAATFYEIAYQPTRAPLAIYSNPPYTSASTSDQRREPSFSDRVELSPKQLLQEKQPKTDIERVACLAFYLAHYRDQPHFKTVDISKVNTDAAQPKFSNTAYAVQNATTKGLLASAPKGYKQLSAIGEQFVVSLPDRDAGSEVLQRLRQRKTKRRNREGSKSNPSNASAE